MKGIESGIGVNVFPLSVASAVVPVSVVGANFTITIAVPGGGLWWYRLWLSDSATDGRPSATPPSSDGLVLWEGVTNSSGAATIVLRNTNAPHTWYLWAIFSKPGVSDAFTVGV